MSLKQNNQTSFGSLFKKLRKDSGYSVGQLVEATKIPQRYIEALELERFESLPPDVYARGFIIKCCDAMGVPDEKERLLRLYAQQGRFLGIRSAESEAPIRKPIIIGPRHIGILATGMFIVFIFAYLLISFIPYVFSPEIVLDNPSGENLIVNFSDINIVGHAKNTAQLTLNGKELYIGENDTFEYIFKLREGVNILKFEAENRLGRTAGLVSRVVYIKN